jgi:hypothetical protein
MHVVGHPQSTGANMRPLHAGLHRMLDFVTVVAFAAAPAVLGLTGTPAMLSYVLAGVHLVLTLVTRFGAGGGPVPLKVHGAIELVVGVVLAVLPFAAGWGGVARTFFAAAGVVILLVWALTAYEPRRAGPPA